MQKPINTPRAGSLILGTDDHLVRVVREWNNEKLSYVKRYMDIFSTAMKFKFRERVYIDLFSGPGRSFITDTSTEVDGSPLLALSTRDPFTTLAFNDDNAKVVGALRERLASVTIPTTITQLDCNIAATKFASDLLSTRQTLGLAFIDPTAFQISFESIARLTARRNVDLVITVMTGYMKRFIGQPNYEQRMDAFFGFPDWREMIEGSHRAPSFGELLTRYKESLKSLGYAHVNDKVNVPNTRGATIYHLVFASSHQLGGKFFDEVVKVKHSGQRRMAL